MDQGRRHDRLASSQPPSPDRARSGEGQSVAQRQASTFDNIFLHGPEDGEQLALLLCRYLELAQRLREVADQSVEVPATNTHSGVSRFHVAAGINAVSPGGGADLVHQVLLEPRDIRTGEEAVDAPIRRDISDKIVHNGHDGLVSAKALVK